AITQRQSPRREILSSSSSAPRSLCWRPSSCRAKNAAPHLQLLSSHLSVTAYIDHLVSCSMRHGVDIKPRFAGREWSRRRRLMRPPLLAILVAFLLVACGQSEPPAKGEAGPPGPTGP